MVILESTSPPRTTLDILLPVLEKTGLECGEDFDLVYSPERVLPGKIFEELINNDRIVGDKPRLQQNGRKNYIVRLYREASTVQIRPQPRWSS